MGNKIPAVSRAEPGGNRFGARHGRLERGGFLERIRCSFRSTSLNRPEKKNALTRDMYDALAAVLKAANADGSARVVCLAGSGDAFTAGNDIADFRSGPPPVSNEVGP
jgi:enoyl-CoA hydratase/carnithine racemase